jgi:hypothetical protein
VFIDIVTESKTCHIYKMVLLTIKVTAHNVSGASNESMNKTINSMIK